MRTALSNILSRKFRERMQADRDAASFASADGTGGSGRRLDDAAGGLSRRELMRSGGAFGAGLLATQLAFRPAAARASGNLPNVVVVGAGLAGVTAAYRLAQVGIPVSLYEASNRVGGRCFTARGFGENQTAEHGGEFIDTRHVHLRGLTSELGLTLEDWFDNGQTMTWPTWVDGQWYAESSFDDDFDALYDVLRRQARDIGALHGGQLDQTALAWGTSTAAARQLDQVSMSDWLDTNMPGTAGTTFGKVLERLIGSELGLTMAEASALNWFMFFIDEDGADSRYHIRGGNDQVPTLAAAALPAGALHFNAPLQWLRRRANGSYEMSFGGQSATVTADRVVLALPYTTLRRVDLTSAGFCSHRLRVISDLAMGTNAKLLLRYNDRPQAHATPLGTWEGFSVDYNDRRESWDSTRRQAGNGSIITLFYGGDDVPSWTGRPGHASASGAFVNNAVNHINATVPGTGSHFTGEAWIDAWVNDPWVRGSYSNYARGQYTDNYRFNHLIEGGVHFAGEHTSTYSQGYLNGGVESGQRAAIEIMQAAGVPVPANIANLPYTPN